MRQYLIAILAIPLIVSGLLVGCGQKAQPAPKPTSLVYTATWSGHFDKAIRLHKAGEFYAALVEYEKALELMPSDDALLAVRTGAYINEGEIYLMLFNGWQAYLCSSKANELLDRATTYEKQGIFWKLMAAQVILITAASTIYIPNNKGEYAYEKAKQLLEGLVETISLPEVHYFLAIANDKLGLTQEARKEFETFLQAPDALVSFTAKDIMRQRAKDWLTHAEK